MAKIDIVKAEKNHKYKFGARKYALVESSTNPGETYSVVKIRLRGKSRHYTYRCTCPDFMFRNRQCKHIYSFKEQE